jgi:hypothetical protein
VVINDVPKDNGVSKLINEFGVLSLPVDSCFSNNSNIISDDDDSDDDDDDDDRVSGVVLVADDEVVVLLFKNDDDGISKGSRLFVTISRNDPSLNAVVWTYRLTTSGIGTIVLYVFDVYRI